MYRKTEFIYLIFLDLVANTAPTCIHLQADLYLDL